MKKKYQSPTLEAVAIAPATIMTNSHSYINETDGGLQLDMHVAGEDNIDNAV